MILFSGIVEGIPVAQGRPRFSTFGGYTRVYDPPKSKAYKKLIQETIQKKEYLIDVPFKFNLDVYLPIPKSTSKKNKQLMLEGLIVPTKKPDVDNYVKGVLDALNQHIWTDDSLIVNLSVKKRYSDNPRIEFTCYDIAL